MTTPRCLLDKYPQPLCVLPSFLPSWPVVGNFIPTNFIFPFLQSSIVLSCFWELTLLSVCTRPTFQPKFTNLTFFFFLNSSQTSQVSEGQWWYLQISAKLYLHLKSGSHYVAEFLLSRLTGTEIWTLRDTNYETRLMMTIKNHHTYTSGGAAVTVFRPVWCSANHQIRPVY